MQPIQQQGRRFPSVTSVTVLFILWALVGACFASSTQQMNSFLAKGVISSQASIEPLKEVSAFFKGVKQKCFYSL